MIRLETERLLLRPIEASDVVQLIDLWSDEQVMRYMGGPRDKEKLAAIFADDLVDVDPPDFDLWPVVEKSNGLVAGQCGFLAKEIDGRDEVELVYVLAVNYWGQGLATEIAATLRDYAFGPCGLKRIVSMIKPDNFASQRVAVKTGMHLESEVVRPGGRTMLLFAITDQSGSQAQRTGLT